MGVRVLDNWAIEFTGDDVDIYNHLTKKQDKLFKDLGTAFLERSKKEEIKKEIKANSTLRMKEVIFHGPATVIYWADGDKTVVKCMEGDRMNPEMGIAMATLKKMLGGSYKEFKRHSAEIIQKDAIKKAEKIVKAVKKVEDTDEPET